MNIFLQNESVRVAALNTGATIRAVVIIEMKKVFNIKDELKASHLGFFFYWDGGCGV